MADPALLDAVRKTAEAALQARVSGEAYEAAAGQALSAARAALDGGHPVAAIAVAEAEGERVARERTAAPLLRAVERAARRLRDVTEEYEAAIALAARVGLPAREIAARAGVSHGTVAAVARRREQQATEAPGPGAGARPQAGVEVTPASESGAGVSVVAAAD